MKTNSMNFLKTLRDLINRAKLSINDCTEFNKGKIEFFKGIPQGDEDAFYDLPTITNVDKHNNYSQYGVLSLEKIGKDIILHTMGRTEGDEGLKDFKLGELENDDMAVICEIADLAFKVIQKP
jgi:hypothetical protein